MLEREKLGGVLLNAQHNFAWLTGGARNGIDLSRENGAATLLVTASGRRYILANNIEMPRLLAEEVSAEMFVPVEYSWQDEKASADLVLKKAEKLDGGEIASDTGFGSNTRVMEGSVAGCRHSLTDGEAERIRRLGRDAATAIDNLVSGIAPGATESEIARRMDAELGVFGISSVVSLAATDERIAKYRHPVPTDSRWNSLLLLVTCAKRQGLIVSLSRLISVGGVSQTLRKKTEAVALVNARLWNATRPGVTGAELYAVASQAYESVGFADEIDKHHQGGAAGYKTREWVAHPASGDVVQDQQAFAWNPSITGTKVEETVLVGADGIEVLTASSIFPSIAIEIDGKNYSSPGILSV